MAARLAVLNGPNLNLLGEREPDIYGTVTLGAVEDSCGLMADTLGLELRFLQTNHEGVLVDWIQDARQSADAIVINPAGFSFNSISVVDALKMFSGPIIELHISNIHARDKLHRHSIVSSVATSVICGAGVYGYIIAMQTAARMLGQLPLSLPQPVQTGPV